MNIKLYNYKGNLKKCNKKDYLTLFKNLEGELRESCNILSPEFTIDLLSAELLENAIINEQGINIVNSNGVSIIVQPEEVVFANEITQLQTCNYARIEMFNRWYFITDFVLLSSNLVQISCEVDVLYTYYEKYINTTAFVDRLYQLDSNELTPEIEEKSKQATLITDNMLIFNKNYSIDYDCVEDLTELVANSKKYNILNIDTSFEASHRIVLNMIQREYQKNDNETTLNFNVPENYITNNLYLSGSSTFNEQYLLSAKELFGNTDLTTFEDKLGLLIANSSDFASYIKSLTYYPFNIPNYSSIEGDLQKYIIYFKGDKGSVKLGPFDVPKNPMNDLFLYKAFKYKKEINNFTFDKYLYINLPGYGVYKAPVTQFLYNINGEFTSPIIQIYLVVDYIGVTEKYIIMSNDRLIEELECKLSMQIGISTTNQDDVRRHLEVAQNNRNNAILNTTIGGLVSIGTTIATGGTSMFLTYAAKSNKALTYKSGAKAGQLRPLGRDLVQQGVDTGSSAISGLGTMIEGFNQANTQYENAKILNPELGKIISGQGSINQLIYNDNRIYEFYNTPINDDYFYKTNGKVWKQSILLNAILDNTYFKVGQIKLEFEAFPNELLELENLLKSGVYK